MGDEETAQSMMQQKIRMQKKWTVVLERLMVYYEFAIFFLKPDYLMYTKPHPNSKNK